MHWLAKVVEAEGIEPSRIVPLRAGCPYQSSLTSMKVLVPPCADDETVTQRTRGTCESRLGPTCTGTFRLQRALDCYYPTRQSGSSAPCCPETFRFRDERAELLRHAGMKICSGLTRTTSFRVTAEHAALTLLSNN